MLAATRHQWALPVRFVHKTEQQCNRCALIKVTRHEYEGGRDLYWTEFWRDMEKVEHDCGKTPPCEARLEKQTTTGEPAGLTHLGTAEMDACGDTALAAGSPVVVSDIDGGLTA